MRKYEYSEIWDKKSWENLLYDGCKLLTNYLQEFIVTIKFQRRFERNNKTLLSQTIWICHYEGTCLFLVSLYKYFIYLK